MSTPNQASHINALPFLQRVAKAYAENEAEILADCCFVFPNKRSATFFNHYLHDYLTPPALMPATTSISELVADLSDLVEASRYDRLFIIYNEYRRITGEDVEFDRFIYWGEMLLSDFDDVDRYLVDASSLFVNVQRFREIRANYLTDDQLRIIGRYWGGVEDYAAEVEGFWQHVNPGGSKASGRFIKLWEVLQELYEAYHARLAERGLSSPGRLYRDAVNKLKHDKPTDYARYIFVGFNVLSASELRIFELLQDAGMADFYWDNLSPGFRGPATLIQDGTLSYANKAMRFIARNMHAFPSKYNIHEGEYTEDDSGPEVTIINVPSRVSQAKVAGAELLKWGSEGALDYANAIDTAVVMPDESLFVTAVNSVPEEFQALNVTMGYPLKRTPVATFMRIVTSLHMRARKSGDKWMYFYEDIMALLSHSVASTIDAEAATKLANEITMKRRYMIDSQIIIDNYPAFAAIFTPVDERSLSSVSKYINGVLDMLAHSLSKLDDRRERNIQNQFLSAYRLALASLTEAAEAHSVEMGEGTAFQLIERALASDTVTMKGEPLKGLQLMGVLETRALDFENVIFMSMNERVFPKKSYTRSFIPDALRRAYRMSTIEHQESIFAYYFYRLMSRAKRVALLYDGRTVGMRHSEMSRYLVQLLYTFRPGKEVKHIGATFDGRAYEPLPVTIAKNERIQKKLQEFLTPGSGKNLSASSINCYLDCPLQFYLRYVEKLDIEDEASDYLDPSTYGTILHETAEHLYASLSPDGKYPVTVTKEWLEKVSSKDDQTVFDLVHRSLDNHYLHLDESQWGKSELFAETLINCNLATQNIKEMLRREIEFAPFQILAAEYPINGSFEIAPGLNVNIRQVIDRIDRVNGRLRIIDYKTGVDATRIKDLSKAFEPSINQSEYRPKAFVQLFFYCLVYALQKGGDQPIMPMIYSMRKMFVDGITKLQFGTDSTVRAEIDDYRDFMDEFQPQFQDKIKEIFNPDVPFEQTPCVGSTACGHCRFQSICGVNQQA